MLIKNCANAERLFYFLQNFVLYIYFSHCYRLQLQLCHSIKTLTDTFKGFFSITVSGNLFFSCVKQTDLANVEARLWGVGSKSYILCFCFRLRNLPKLWSLSQISSLNNTLSRKFFG